MSQYSSLYASLQHFTDNSINSFDKAMASTVSLDVSQLIDVINRDGFIYLKNAAKGLQADEFARKEFLITTVKEVNFCKVHTFDDSVSEFHCCIFLLFS